MLKLVFDLFFHSFIHLNFCSIRQPNYHVWKKLICKLILYFKCFTRRYIIRCIKGQIVGFASLVETPGTFTIARSSIPLILIKSLMGTLMCTYHNLFFLCLPSSTQAPSSNSTPHFLNPTINMRRNFLPKKKHREIIFQKLYKFSYKVLIKRSIKFHT